MQSPFINRFFSLSPFPRRLAAVAPGPSLLDTDALSTAPQVDTANRYISTTYAGGGNAIWRVRRSSDNLEADIAGVTTALGSFVDTTALLAHVGANDGFLVTEYSQRAVNDRTQGTAASQPKVVSSGVVITNANGEPTALYDGTDDLMASGSLTHNAVYTRFQSLSPTPDDRGVLFGFATGAVYVGRYDDLSVATDINFGVTGTNCRIAGTDYTSGVDTLDDTYNAANGTPGALVVASALGVGVTGAGITGGITTAGSRMVNGYFDFYLSFATDNTAERASIESLMAA